MIETDNKNKSFSESLFVQAMDAFDNPTHRSAVRNVQSQVMAQIIHHVKQSGQKQVCCSTSIY